MMLLGEVSLVVIYIYNGSHGCVNLPYDAAKIIYENTDVGTPVLVHK